MTIPAHIERDHEEAQFLMQKIEAVKKAMAKALVEMLKRSGLEKEVSDEEIRIAGEVIDQTLDDMFYELDKRCRETITDYAFRDWEEYVQSNRSH